MNYCPKCHSKMRTGKRRDIGDELFRYRSCTACDYRDRAWFVPEKLVRVEPVLTRTLSTAMADSRASALPDNTVR